MTIEQIRALARSLYDYNTNGLISPSGELGIIEAILDVVGAGAVVGLQWNDEITYNTTDNLYAEAHGRFYKSKIDNNTGNEPPNVLDGAGNYEDTNWIEISKSDSSTVKEWLPGLYSGGLQIVYYDYAGSKDEWVGVKLWKLDAATRPYESTDINAEIEAATAVWVPAQQVSKLANTDELDEGATNQYFTEARAIASKLAGYVKAAAVSAIASTTSVLEAIGILEKGLDGKVDKVAGSGLISDAEKAIFADKYTQAETDNLVSAAVSDIIWKEDVATFTDLATTFPTPVEGWTSVVNDENKIYRYNGTAWVSIGNATVPMATALVDGKMSKEDFVKLQGIAAEATKNETDADLRDRSTHTGEEDIDIHPGFAAAPNESVRAKGPAGTPVWVPISEFTGAPAFEEITGSPYLNNALVDALDEVYNSSATNVLDNITGNPLNLNTTAKRIVESINEILAAIGGLGNLTAEDIDTLAEINAILTDADIATQADLAGKKDKYITVPDTFTAGQCIDKVGDTWTLASATVEPFFLVVESEKAITPGSTYDLGLPNGVYFWNETTQALTLTKPTGEGEVVRVAYKQADGEGVFVYDNGYIIGGESEAVAETGASIKTKLEALVGEGRLSSSAIKGLPDGLVFAINYAEMEAYTGASNYVFMLNKTYGGLFERDDLAVATPNNQGIVRAGSSRMWKRSWDENEINVNWWIENEAIDGSAVVSSYIQSAINYALTQPTRIIRFDGYYLCNSMDWSTPGLGGCIFEGNGSRFKLNYAGDNEYLALMANGGGEAGTTLRNMYFIGTKDEDATYTANKHRLLKVDGHRFLNIERCHFTGFTSQAIYLESVGGATGGFFRGTEITKCTFTDQPYDSTTTEQAAIYFTSSAEYSSVNNCKFTKIVQAVKGIDSANLDISHNQAGEFVGPLISEGVDFTRAVFYFSTSATPVNNGKINFIGNKINHISTAQLAFIVIGTNTVNITNTATFIANECLSNNYKPSIYLKDFNNPVMIGNHLRAVNVTQATYFIQLDNVSNAVVTANNFVGGRYCVGLLNGSNDLHFDESNNLSSTLLTSGYVEIISGNIRERVSRQSLTATGGETQLAITKTLPTNTSEITVHKNGMKMLEGSGYTVSAANNRLDFSPALAASDVIIVDFTSKRGYKKI